MILTTQQVTEILGVSRDVVRRLVKDGKLTPCNAKADGAKKFFMKFEASHVRAVKKELGLETTRKPATDDGIQALVAWAALDADKRAILLKLGQRFSTEDLETLLTL